MKDMKADQASVEVLVASIVTRFFPLIRHFDIEFRYRRNLHSCQQPNAGQQTLAKAAAVGKDRFGEFAMRRTNTSMLNLRLTTLNRDYSDSSFTPAIASTTPSRRRIMIGVACLAPHHAPIKPPMRAANMRGNSDQSI